MVFAELSSFLNDGKRCLIVLNDGKCCLIVMNDGKCCLIVINDECLPCIFVL